MYKHIPDVWPDDRPVSSSDDETSSLCATCAGIDLDALAQRHEYLSPEGEKVVALESRSILASSRCLLCRLFATISPGKQTSLGKKPNHLRAFSAHFTYADYLAPYSTLKGSTLLGVVSTFKRRSGATRTTESEAAIRTVIESQASGLLFLEPQENAKELSAFAVRKVEQSFDLAVARQWLDYCRQNHTSTCAQQSSLRPTSLRLIDCTTRRVCRLRRGLITRPCRTYGVAKQLP
jgi:hypothetical protein